MLGRRRLHASRLTMQLTDPISVYIAGTNLEAQMVANHLTSLGIPAYAIEDTSGVSTFSFGVISQFHKPMVYVERTQADDARKLIEEYEGAANRAEHHTKSSGELPDYCPACGERVAHGTPTCPECERPLHWEKDEESDDAPYVMSNLKAWKKQIILLIFVGPLLLGWCLPMLLDTFQRLFTSSSN